MKSNLNGLLTGMARGELNDRNLGRNTERYSRTTSQLFGQLGESIVDCRRVQMIVQRLNCV